MSAKRINGVAHDIAHHAASSASALHPHLGAACREAGVLGVALDLLADPPYGEGFPVSEPLALATAALRRTFADMLAAAASSRDELASARLRFQFSAWRRDDYTAAVRAEFALKNGRTFQHVIEPTG